MDPLIREKYKYLSYLVGSMQTTAEGDCGQSKRELVEQALIARNVYPINPVRLERSKTEMNSEELNKKMVGWIASGNWELFKEMAWYIWKGKSTVDEKGQITHIPGDIDYVKMSDWITFTLNKGDSPCGSFAECGIAMDLNIPIFVITDMPKKELRQSLLQMVEVSNGEVFMNLHDYLVHIDKIYKLKKENQ